ncbi:STAS domain-containing protein [Phytohalomonas tamaricis]|uniref:STAS domain-containing protein n=1 Tax=Phytohalomonas tamaricis TaxID=2081032 RepID=UPI000D0B601A|nr:STAS domain-containing protein [Phytohalomonas tamaricis]
MTTTLYDHGDVCLIADEQVLRVSGAPDFDDAAPLAAAGRKWIDERKDALVLDASGVESVSSAMLSVLLEWIRDASRHDVSISAIKLSPGLRGLVELADLEEIFPA